MHVFGEDLHERLARAYGPAHQQLGDHQCQRVLIRGRADLGARGLLRRDVVRCAQQRAGRRQRASVGPVVHHQLGDAEVQQLGCDLAVEARHEHVVRLEVAVHDAPAMREPEPRRQILEQRRHDGWRQARSGQIDQQAQRCAAQVFHHVVGQPPAAHVEVVDLDDVRVAQFGQHAGFAQEAPLEVLVGAAWHHDLERCRPQQRAVGGVVDDTHAAHAQHGIHVVVAEGLAHEQPGVRQLQGSLAPRTQRCSWPHCGAGGADPQFHRGAYSTRAPGACRGPAPQARSAPMQQRGQRVVDLGIPAALAGFRRQQAQGFFGG